MLVLSRKVGQRILIGDDISITIVRVAQGGVRIGIDAPKELPVVREELKDKAGEEHSRDLTSIADTLAQTMQCTCENVPSPPLKITGHSLMCRIHLAALAAAT